MSTLITKISISRILDEVVESNGDGPPSYQDGWSDGRVADAVGTTVQQVVAVRKALYGPRFATPANSSLLRFQGRLEQLEARISRVEKHMNEVTVSQSGGATQIREATRLDISPHVPRWDKD